MATFTFAHISDLHFSPGAYIGGNHKHSIRKLIGIENLFKGKQFDRVFVTGDISNAGDNESLLRANTWLFSRLKVDAEHDTGLGLSPANTILVPGNHDAFNSDSSYKDHIELWQKSLDNYNEFFPMHKFCYPDTIRYDWLNSDGCSAFIVSADTCYLGDQQPDGVASYAYALQSIPDMARGKFSREQSELLLSLFELGTRGKLRLPTNDGFIPAEQFSASLKIFVAHHYLFETPGQRIKPHLQIRTKRSVFTNLASCDFDIYLCGHKHEASFWPTTYAVNMPKRERTRYLINVFRRLVGLTGLPVQMKDEHGKKVDKGHMLMVALVTKILPVVAAEPSENETINTEYVNRVFEVLRKGLDDPSHFEKDLTKLLKMYGIPRGEVLAPGELEELARQIRGTCTKEERAKLRQLSKHIETTARRLTTRPFVQVVSSSSAKATGNPQKERSVNVYEIERRKGGFLVEAQRYVWRPSTEEFGPEPECQAHFFSAERRSVIVK